MLLILVSDCATLSPSWWKCLELAAEYYPDHLSLAPRLRRLGPARRDSLLVLLAATRAVVCRMQYASGMPTCSCPVPLVMCHVLRRASCAAPCAMPCNTSESVDSCGRVAVTASAPPYHSPLGKWPADPLWDLTGPSRSSTWPAEGHVTTR